MSPFLRRTLSNLFIFGAAVTRVFFSYSHRDETLRDRLEVHLKVLKRSGLIETWHDRSLIAGSDLGDSIDAELESADIALLLVSPDFLDSDYCYSREMGRALERRELGEMEVVPIILKPCMWLHTPIAKLTALPKDGKPVIKHSDLDEAFLEVAEGIKRLIQSRTKPGTKSSPRTVSPASAAPSAMLARPSAPRSSNLGIKREITQREIDLYLDETFDFLARFFENSLSELQRRDATIEGAFKRIDAQRFSATIYRHGKALSRCWISMGGTSGFGSGIRYSTSEGNSMNEMLSVENDGHGLTLKTMGMNFTRRGEAGKLTQEGGAEFFWEMFLQHLQ